jgi:hypothetical protein
MSPNVVLESLDVVPNVDNGPFLLISFLVAVTDVVLWKMKGRRNSSTALYQMYGSPHWNEWLHYCLLPENACHVTR